jgi:hypothetical protein
MPLAPSRLANVSASMQNSSTSRVLHTNHFRLMPPAALLIRAGLSYAKVSQGFNHVINVEAVMLTLTECLSTSANKIRTARDIFRAWSSSLPVHGTPETVSDTNNKNDKLKNHLIG